MPEHTIQDILRQRKSQSPYGYGLSTAQPYVSRFLEHADGDTLKKFGVDDREALLKHAGEVLTYANEDMITEKAASSHKFKDLLPDGVTAPKNTLMVIKHVLTTTKEDRDNDVLETSGAQLDPKAPLLWQHMHTMPIGSVLAKLEQSDDKLVVASALLDLNDLTSDAAKLVEANVLRFSHGFRALEFEEQKQTETGFPGFRVTKFEIMEASLVSVPSNVDAQVEAIASQKFSSGFFKSMQEHVLDGHRTTIFKGVDTSGFEDVKEKATEATLPEDIGYEGLLVMATNLKTLAVDFANQIDELQEENESLKATVEELEDDREQLKAATVALEKLESQQDVAHAVAKLLKCETSQLKTIVASIQAELTVRELEENAEGFRTFVDAI